MDRKFWQIVGGGLEGKEIIGSAQDLPDPEDLSSLMGLPKATQEIHGPEIVTETWWDGNEFVLWNHVIEDRHFMTGNLGPELPCQGTTVWIKKDMDGLVVKQMSGFAPMFQHKKYVGPVSVKCMISEKDHETYYMDAIFGFRFDSIYALLGLINDKSPRSFFAQKFRAEWHNGYATSQRITIPPYPYEEKALLEAFAKDVIIQGRIGDYPSFWMQDVYSKRGKLHCTGTDAILGIIATRGNSLGGSIGSCYRAIRKLRVGGNLQYRTDAGKKAARIIRQLEKWGISVS
jgi:hypothetical protein